MSAAPTASSELWTNGQQGPAIEALVGAGGRAPRRSPAACSAAANFLGITWTFGYLSALAVFVGVIAVGGLLLYLEARTRTRVSGYVMARRLASAAARTCARCCRARRVASAGLVLGAVLAAGRGRAGLPPAGRRPLARRPRCSTSPAGAGRQPQRSRCWSRCSPRSYAQRAADRADPATVLREDA